VKLKKLVSLGALSITLGAAPMQGHGQTTHERRVTPPTVDVELQEEPRARIDHETSPKTRATRRFFTHQDILTEKLPEYASTIWEETFTTPDDNVIFLPTKNEESIPDYSITTLDKDTTWTPSYLKERLPHTFHEYINDTINSPYPWNAKQLTQDLGQDDVTWTSGRKTILEENLSEHKEFLQFYEDAFTDVNLPEGTVAQLGVESAFNPHAESYAACGIGQIRTGHLRRISNEQPLPDCDNPVMAKLTANIMKAQMLVYDTPYFESSTMYHSGLGNRNKAVEIGEHINPDQPRNHNYYTGLQAMFENSEDEQLNELLGSAGSDTRHYPLQVNAFRSVYHDMRDTVGSKPMNTYRIENSRSIQAVSEQAKVPADVIRDYNPHIQGGSANAGTYVNLPKGTSIPGDNVSTWHDPTNTFLHRLRNYDFSNKPDSLVAELDDFIDLAEQRGNHWWSGALRFVRNNQKAQNAVRLQAETRVRRITNYLSEEQSGSTTSRGRR
jgi:hypothetical protein